MLYHVGGIETDVGVTPPNKRPATGAMCLIYYISRKLVKTRKMSKAKINIHTIANTR
jgi:hypothetical protein